MGKTPFFTDILSGKFNKECQNRFNRLVNRLNLLCMDTVTHVVLGAAIGEAVMGKQVGKKAMLWGALAANAPDADAIANLWLTDIESLVVHRGLSHSLYLALLLGPLLGWILWKLYKGEGKLISWMILITLNAVIHDLLDTCTVYGTGLFTPFSQYRYSWDNIFVADPLYTLPLLATFIALLALPTPHPLRRAWNRFGLITSSAYLIFTFYNHYSAESALYNATKAQGIKMEEHFAAPTLFNNFLWNLVAEDSLGYWVGYYSILDKNKTPDLHYVPKNLELLGSWAYHRDIKTMILFSKGFYCVTESEGKRWFNDLRFGQVAGWENPQSTFAFAFDLSEDADNTLVVQKGRIEGSKGKVLSSMWRRMMGN